MDPRRRFPILRLAAVALLASSLLAACGSDDDSGTASNSGSGAGGETETSAGPPPVSLEGKVNDKGTEAVGGAEVALEQDNFYFSPTFVKVKGGTTVKVALKNEGSTTHTFTIASPAVDVVVEAGKTASVDVALPASGSVPFFCRFHQGSGMQGAFVVT